MDEKNLPVKYRPLSPWAYFGYSILFSFPILGWVLLILFALDDSNINRRNYARGHFVLLLLVFILIGIIIAFGFAEVIITWITDIHV